MNAVQRTNWALPLVLVPVATVAVFFIVLGFSWSKFHDSRLDEGDVALSEISAHLSEHRQSNNLQLFALADVTLPSPLQTGLDNGVPLTFVLKLRLYQPVRFWFDKSLQSYERRYRLTYYELTRHYRVDSLEEDISRNYRSLSSALNGLGEFNDVRFALGDTELVQLQDAWAGLTLSLDTAALPLALQPLIKFTWALSSGEYQWPVI